nr:tetratricopeptide repeat protein [Streptomyces sp. 846.5]
MRQEAPRRLAGWPHLVGSVPVRALGFQERAEALRLRAVLEVEGTAVVGQVLSGLGGVGKTQLAADFARTAFEAGDLDVLVWVTAASRQAVVDAYTRAAVDLLGVEPDDRAAAVFLAWLQPAVSRPVCRWLVVLDDVADPGDLAGLWPPACPRGRTVVTTRRRDAALTGPGRRRVDVGVFAPAEALAALREALAERDHPAQPEDQLRALAAGLGYLPLAISQAAAYIADAGITCAAYRALLSDHARSLADALPHPAHGQVLPDDQAATVAVTWSLSLERADAMHPGGLARPMLQLAAMLDPNGIPRTVLVGAPALDYLTAHRTPPPGPDAAPPGWAGEAQEGDAVAALRALHRLSLIDHTPDQPHTAVRVHQLVQRTVRDTLTPADRDRLAHTAADALTAAWPAVESDTALAQALRANTQALTGHAEDALHRPDAHAVLYRTGKSLGDTGQVTAARDHFQHLTDTTRRHLGPDHPDTLTARGYLASWRGEAGDAAGAVAAFAELLADRVRVLGTDHPATLTTRNNLAYWRGEAGDAAGAAAAFAELLADQVRVRGADHPATLTTRGNLARWRGDAGDAAGAAAATAELLEHMVRVLGADRPDTLTARNNLASWRGEAGDAAGAAAAFAELLEHMVRVLGADHPDTLTTRNNLAYWRGEAGDAAGAAAATAELLEHMVRVLGADHPDTLITRGNLARWRGEAGDAAGAAAATAELLEHMVRVLGADHPATLTTQGNLASWRGDAGDAAGAAAATAELLEHMVRVLGADHPDTLTTRNNLVYWRGKVEKNDSNVR